jgi:ribosomal-protein-alanine N-acetyltransferase
MNKEIFQGLEGNKIYFAPVKIDDVKAIHKYASDEDVSRFIGWKLMNSEEETYKFVEEIIRRVNKGTHLYASIFTKENKELIGTAMIFGFNDEDKHAEIGYVLDKDHWRKGYGAETIKLVNEYVSKHLDLHRLNAFVVDVNVGSAKALEKNGFMLEGKSKDFYLIDGRYYDSLIYGKIFN